MRVPFFPSVFLPFSFFPLSSRPPTYRISLNGFISVFPAKLTKADQDSSLVSVGRWERGPPCLPGHSRSCLLLGVWGRGKERGPQLPCSSIYLFIALTILCSCPPQNVSSMWELCVFHIPYALSICTMTGAQWEFSKWRVNEYMNVWDCGLVGQGHKASLETSCAQEPPATLCQSQQGGLLLWIESCLL